MAVHPETKFRLERAEAARPLGKPAQAALRDIGKTPDEEGGVGRVGDGYVAVDIVAVETDAEFASQCGKTE